MLSRLSVITRLLPLVIIFGLRGQEASFELEEKTIILATLEQGCIHIRRCSIEQETTNAETLFSIDLVDTHNIYDKVLCNTDTLNCIAVRSSTNRAVADYCLNWGALFGRDIAHTIQGNSLVTVEKDSADPRLLTITIATENSSTKTHIVCNKTVTDACACLVQKTLIQDLQPTQNVCSLAECCSLGIIVTKKHSDTYVQQEQLQEIELERIIDAMLQDGTIRIKTVSPFMAKLRTIGSTLFVQYLALKNKIRQWWHPVQPIQENM